ncbi:sensor domain-containing diguanylate cyclase [Marinomonas algarum]|uniref:Sensor domain-containing diguanylate cyclase n=1 Tax=Marinomonas algarum TaxID=2883105 RepID=A0A9X1IQC8_9GAMM|nr:sensor domain-containing diguanylate cyclase [Marinomonas algarum]MCB5162211.1 sensor domain-containing diguanylate cyclase [Marinomonas algarum]
MDKKLSTNLADVMELMLNPVCVLDLSGEFVFVSAAFEQMFGYAPQEVIGKPMIDMVYQEDRASTLKKASEIIVKKIIPECENRWVHKNGRVINVLWSARWSEEHQVIIAVAHDITERKKMETLLAHAAQHDDLTKLPNRTLLLDRLGTSITLADIKRTDLSVMFIDIDGFKEVNDHHGHTIGDKFLQKIAKRLAECVRKTDTVGRLGGDEFLVILNGASQVDSITMVAEKIRAQFSKDFVVDGIHLKVASSIGIARYPQDGQQPLALIQAADEAMYKAKNNGGDKIVIAANT